jgi:hypothetical protein
MAFNLTRARVQDANLARALVWLGPNNFRWRTVSILNGPNAHGQYQVQCIRDGWYATTISIKNLSDREKDRVFNYEQRGRAVIFGR